MRPAVAVPGQVTALAQGRPMRLVWHNEAGGLTYETGDDRFVKWSPTVSGIDLTAEADRLAWAIRFHPVPRVLASGSDPEGSWLVTAALPGWNAAGPRWRAEPATRAPNTLLAADGRWTAHVDLGLLGTADRWADIAVATWSTQWNYGPGWEPLLLDAYGIEPDPDRTSYYRLLWDLSS
jgi:kanamycin kinase